MNAAVGIRDSVVDEAIQVLEAPPPPSYHTGSFYFKKAAKDIKVRNMALQRAQSSDGAIPTFSGSPEDPLQKTRSSPGAYGPAHPPLEGHSWARR